MTWKSVTQHPHISFVSVFERTQREKLNVLDSHNVPSGTERLFTLFVLDWSTSTTTSKKTCRAHVRFFVKTFFRQAHSDASGCIGSNPQPWTWNRDEREMDLFESKSAHIFSTFFFSRFLGWKKTQICRLNAVGKEHFYTKIVTFCCFRRATNWGNLLHQKVNENKFDVIWGKKIPLDLAFFDSDLSRAKEWQAPQLFVGKECKFNIWERDTDYLPVLHGALSWQLFQEGIQKRNTCFEWNH